MTDLSTAQLPMTLRLTVTSDTMLRLSLADKPSSKMVQWVVFFSRYSNNCFSTDYGLHSLIQRDPC